MDFLIVEEALLKIDFVVGLLLIATLAHRRLAYRYPFFFAYLVGNAVCSLILFQFDPRTIEYARAYPSCALVMIALRGGVVFGLFEKICGHFTNWGNIRKYVAAMLLAVSGIAAWAFFAPASPQNNYPQRVALLLYRWEELSAALFLLLTRLYLYNFIGARPPIRPNVETHWKLVIAYFTIDALGSWDALMRTSPGTREIENTIILLAEITCTCLWIKFLTREGEVIPLRIRKYTDEQGAAIHERERSIHSIVTGLPGEIDRRTAQD